MDIYINSFLFANYSSKFAMAQLTHADVHSSSVAVLQYLLYGDRMSYFIAKVDIQALTLFYVEIKSYWLYCSKSEESYKYILVYGKMWGLGGSVLYIVTPQKEICGFNRKCFYYH